MPVQALQIPYLIHGSSLNSDPLANWHLANQFDTSFLALPQIFNFRCPQPEPQKSSEATNRSHVPLLPRSDYPAPRSKSESHACHRSERHSSTAPWASVAVRLPKGQLQFLDLHQNPGTNLRRPPRESQGLETVSSNPLRLCNTLKSPPHAIGPWLVAPTPRKAFDGAFSPRRPHLEPAITSSIVSRPAGPAAPPSCPPPPVPGFFFFPSSAHSPHLPLPPRLTALASPLWHLFPPSSSASGSTLFASPLAPLPPPPSPPPADAPLLLLLLLLLQFARPPPRGPSAALASPFPTTTTPTTPPPAMADDWPHGD
ncbi:hypothetical protein Mp_1g26790 [Marchantia polymorpha subsp. ruderalis]|uniref:Uncharacterized protein n=2 Tax=Marchantia polymorpha TaxID=3197 RepID=A0AAF6AUM7_MARPO|nr:hypothetical protein MARPO_0002s0199 [Marchantia polymorpha]BBN00148.1 hypothetical protein Mp_1g26790 [Marchantia polymorpha subsp. ruderalis]|eukprot:PTQ49734.1 hypothetical protein MARPO_0002s0199 [Marchantia polymorpha]